MGTFTAEEVAAIPGAISSAELFSQAVKTGKRVKYYVLHHHEVLTRYVAPNGNITNGKGRRYADFTPGVPRFTNYWHAYAYKCKLDQQEEN